VGKTSIAWCDYTFNLAWGCIESSAGCDFCYARVLAHRYGFDVWGKGKPRRTFGAKYWNEPLRWNRSATALGERHRVFCSSMTDVFLNDKAIDVERIKLWPLIDQTSSLDWLILTKHPERFRGNIPDVKPNVWLGVSVEDNSAAWRVDYLRRTPAAIRFLSVEPMLGPIDNVNLDGIDQVIVGGESGHGARLMDIAWVRDVRDRCTESGTAFFLKQLGGSVNKRGHEDAILDGRRWTEYPKTKVEA
jgi:protein gp37